MPVSIRIIVAQLNFLVGDIQGNTDKIIATIRQARDELQGDMVVFPELAVCGYSPEDLLLRPGMAQRAEVALAQIANEAHGIDVVVGHPQQTVQGLFNTASVIRDGKVIATYHKHYLPNIEVFDEKRYFLSGQEVCLVRVKGVPIAINICEDIWHPDTAFQARETGAQAMIVLNASPYSYEKVMIRRSLLEEQAPRAQMPIIYVNTVGGQDELVFDGGSFAVDATGAVCVQLPFFEEAVVPIELMMAEKLHIVAQPVPALLSKEESIYHALVLGVRDYVNKNNFPGALIALSGGVDSALTLAVAVDALGADRVKAVHMPSRYTAHISTEDSLTMAKVLGVSCEVLSIESVFQSFLDTLKPVFQGLPLDATEENIQARARGVILMAMSNKFNKIVLSTGNKSEMAVGYATLYGDMVGGFCVLKDVTKTWVYRLCDYRNQISLVIPERIITRAPSAELAADQTDQDTLPPYDILDDIIVRYIELDQDIDTIVAQGFDRDMVRKIIKWIDRSEYKRRQAPPGVRVTSRAFGRDRRYPITSGYSKMW